MPRPIVPVSGKVYISKVGKIFIFLLCGQGLFMAIPLQLLTPGLHLGNFYTLTKNKHIALYPEPGAMKIILLPSILFTVITATCVPGCHEWGRASTSPSKTHTDSLNQAATRSRAGENDPYKKDGATNYIYHLLFCDSLALFKENVKKPYSYPYDILFSDRGAVSALQKIAGSPASEPRTKMLAYNKLRAAGHKPLKKELLGVIVEVALDEGLDVLASFADGTARYINHTEKMIIWERTDDEGANKITRTLFEQGRQIVDQIGPWNKPRRPFPTKGNARVTFLVSDGLYFGEGPTDVLFNDPLDRDALKTAMHLME